MANWFFEVGMCTFLLTAGKLTSHGHGWSSLGYDLLRLSRSINDRMSEFELGMDKYNFRFSCLF